MAVDEAGTQDLWHPLAILWVAQALPVELALGLTCLLIHLGHNVLDQVNLRAEGGQRKEKKEHRRNGDGGGGGM